jgi:hypothetical protein
MKMKTIVSQDVIINKIYFIRGKRVMLDRDLADLYQVTTGNFNKAMKRNSARFPDDFMFQIKEKEFKNLIFQNGISSWGGTRKMPYAFTEQGIAMLSSILNSQRAITINIQIIRVFTRLRNVIISNKDILVKLERLERKVSGHDDDLQTIFEQIRELLAVRHEPMRKIGFRQTGLLNKRMAKSNN